MSAKLKVDELRAQLSLRGLGTAGTKPALVRRLESALCKEQESVGESGDAIAPSDCAITKKRSREAAEDVIAVDRLSKMPLRELRELAALRGVPANGSKKELVERLSANAEKDVEEAVEDCHSIGPSNDGTTKKRSREAAGDSTICRLVGAFDRLSESIDSGASAIASSFGHWTEKVGKAVMDMSGYELRDLGLVLRHLASDEIEARIFIISPEPLRRTMIDDILRR